jgi:hypothetical protein
MFIYIYGCSFCGFQWKSYLCARKPHDSPVYTQVCFEFEIKSDAITYGEHVLSVIPIRGIDFLVYDNVLLPFLHVFHLCVI